MIEELIGPLPFNIVKEMDNYQEEFEEVDDRKGFYTFKNAPELSEHFENRRSFFNRKLSFEYRLARALGGSQADKYYTKELADSFKDMILSMLKWDPSERVDLEQLVYHPFMVHMEKLSEQSALDIFANHRIEEQSSAKPAASNEKNSAAVNC
jgi:hypothetical protein